MSEKTYKAAVCRSHVLASEASNHVNACATGHLCLDLNIVVILIIHIHSFTQGDYSFMIMCNVFHSPRVAEKVFVCDCSFNLHCGPLWHETLFSLCYRGNLLFLCFLVGCCDVHPCFGLKYLGMEEAQNWMINLVNRGTS